MNLNTSKQGKLELKYMERLDDNFTRYIFAVNNWEVPFDVSDEILVDDKTGELASTIFQYVKEQFERKGITIW